MCHSVGGQWLGNPSRIALAISIGLLAGFPGAARSDTAPRVTPPKDHFGFNIGDDYCLANYRQLADYWAKLEKESDRMQLVQIGKTAEGRPHLMAIVTSPVNHKNLDRYRDIARRMATAETLDPAEARKLAADGKAVVWIDAGLHATEVLCAQMMIETVYQILTSTDPETLRILDDVIILFVHANPDGHDLTADWYMRKADPRRRSSQGLPRLYQKYIGHDNNRDFYANTQAETKNMNRVMYREWFPHIVYNHHQTGPAGTVLFCPPFRDPFNYNVDPLVVSGIDAVGAAMMQRFLAENKPGATSRSGARYSTWWNGGLRTTCYFHNMIGLLTETIGNPTPTQIPFNPGMHLPRADYLAPVPPQTWRFRQSVDYSVTANKAVLDYASRHREQLLQNIWLMGKNAIDRGNKDSWTITPKDVQAAQLARRGGWGGPNEDGTGPPRTDDGKAGAAKADDARPGVAKVDDAKAGGGKAVAGKAGGGRGGRGGRGAAGGGNAGAAEYARLFHDPAKRDPRGFIIPANQTDFLTATKFVNILIATGCTVQRATAPFTVAGKNYPAGSYVVKAAQPFRAHVMDMFEPQDHPNDFAFPGAPPTAPYDIAGWTLAFQMGVQFDRILDGFDGPFEVVKDELPPPPARVIDAEGAVGFFLHRRTNDAFRAVNRLLKAGEEVRRLQSPVTIENVTHLPGLFFIPKKATTVPLLEKLAAELGTRFIGVKVAPGKEAVALKPLRIGLWDRYGGSMPSGWTRWLLEQFEYPFQVVFPPELDKGDLNQKFDVLVLVDGAIPGPVGPGGGRGGRGGGGRGGPDAGGDQPPGGAGGDQPPGAGADLNVPAEYRAQRGNVSVATTVPQLKKFLEAGGTVITIGSSTSLATHLKLPVTNHLATKDAEGKETVIPRDKFYVPGSVLRTRVDPNHPLAWGLSDQVDVMFSASPTFRLPADAEAHGLKRVAWYDSKTPLRSGWAWGQEHLEGGTAIVEATVGKGKLLLFGPQILFRAQPHGTFKFFFNSLAQAGLSE